MFHTKLRQCLQSTCVNLSKSVCPCKKTFKHTAKRYYHIICNTRKDRNKTFFSNSKDPLFGFVKRPVHSEPVECDGTNDPNDDPVMYNEVLQFLNLLPGSTVVDMTFGTGGHATKILETVPDVRIFALDRDPAAYECAQKLREKYPNQVVPLLGRFSELPQLMKEQKILDNSIDGFLFEFGCSSMQMQDASRGFNLSHDGPLDMRMDGLRNPNEPTAANVLEAMDELDLIRVLKTYGQEKRAKDIARAVVETRCGFGKLKTTKDLVQLVESLVGAFAVNNLNLHMHTAAKTFKALKIFVNNELNEINYGMLLAHTYLKLKGRMVTIAHTTMEDIIVKQQITARINDNQLKNQLLLKYSNCIKTYNDDDFAKLTHLPWKMLHKHVIIPTKHEQEMNPRSRSAKLRALEKCTRRLW